MSIFSNSTLGFIGLGVMGGAMCRNMASKHPADVYCFDTSEAAVAAVLDSGAKSTSSVLELAERADVIFLSLPGGRQVETVCIGKDGIAHASNLPSIIVDLSTTTVADARSIAEQLSAKHIRFADAPVARTREAAQRGELSIMVGADEDDFKQIEPLLFYIGSDITRCGGVGCGQVVKLANNALVFENTLALAEMMVVAERAGVAPETLLDAVAKGSGDSFVLRNHGRKSLLPRAYPEKAFPPEYAVKDLGYIRELADQVGVRARVVEQTTRYYQAAIDHGWTGRYFPVVREVIDAGIDPDNA